jgi:hypothetical protein
VVAIAAVMSVLYLKSSAFPVMDERVSVRAFWRAHPEARGACAGDVKRDVVYGLSYYSEHPLIPCEDDEHPRLVSRGGQLALE